MFKPYKADRFLYHFTSSDTAINHTLPTQKLRFSPYSRTNDPYEAKTWSITIKNYLEEIRKLNDPNEKKEIVSAIISFNSKRQKYINIVKNKVKILCFSKDSENSQKSKILCFSKFNKSSNTEKNGFKYGWGYPRMWAQYGENHRGICLVFDKEKLAQNIGNLNFDCYEGDIKYHNNLIDKKLNEIQLKTVLTEGIGNAIMNRIERNIQSFFFQKALDWRDEREFRFLLKQKNYDKKNDFVFVDIENSLKVVVVGPEIDKEKEKTLLNVMKNLNVRLYTVNWDYSCPMVTEDRFQDRNRGINNPFV